MNTKDIGATISKLRKEKGMTQKELAEQLYVSTSTVSKWETKGVVPDIYMLKNVGNILGVSLEELIEDDENSTALGEACISENAEKSQTAKKAFLFRTKAVIVLVIVFIVVVGIVCSYIYQKQVAGPTFEVVDEFLDDTSKHWGYETLYHVVVEFEGELGSDTISVWGDILRKEYEHWFEKVVTIKISYFDEYTDRNQVYNTDCHTFLFPRDR